MVFPQQIGTPVVFLDTDGRPCQDPVRFARIRTCCVGSLRQLGLVPALWVITLRTVHNAGHSMPCTSLSNWCTA